MLKRKKTKECKLFISYSRNDEDLKKKFLNRLNVLLPNSEIPFKIWSDRRIVPGDAYKEKIEKRLNESEIIIFLVTKNFQNSEFITKVELPLAFRLMQEKKSIILPVLIDNIDIAQTRFKDIQTAPSNGKAINLWTDKTEGIEMACLDIRYSFNRWAMNNGVKKNKINRAVRKLTKGSLITTLLAFSHYVAYDFDFVWSNYLSKIWPTVIKWFDKVY